MRLSCLQENLSKGLAIVGRAAASRSTLPITNNVLLSTDEGRLKLSATNLEMAVSCWIGAKVEEEGATTVPAKLLTDFVATLPNDKIEIALSAKKIMTLKCRRFEARMTGVDAKDFPPIPKVEGGVSVKIDVNEFKKGIARVVFAAATDESRPVLTGINAEFDGGVLTLAAADGFRLAVYKMALAEPASQKVKAIIPSKTLSEVSRLITDGEETIGITVDSQKSQILFRLKNIELVSQLLQGSFPQYNQIIPQSHTTRSVIEVAQFLMAAKTAQIFARDGGGIVRLIMTPGGGKAPGRLSITARSEEIGDDQAELDAAVSGEESKIAFNGKYLLDVLSVLSEDQVALEVTGPSSPGVLRPVGTDNYVHVVMPMFVQW
ncbi:DNA polymerase-3 subunit beta [Dehalogenimonas formicexedens]|uniref:Beta sliding clamp n=1 Tax=Dehalogenimonas formicexedens TaxID=1839801 RepID=A0A1P8F623_9CHLR|nr:DNA polymerase III subunit beta [Dehalogenimonas formicexedens]APV43888.1 DNA polymerase-3 subunit beta [Dehalogenimonas formicexedens]